MNSPIDLLTTIASKESAGFSTLQVQIESSLLKESFKYSSTSAEQKFHSASVGKMMTMVVIVQAIEKGLIDWNTPIAKLFKPAVLLNLFTYKGVDYASSVTVEQLLGHTSGINDYFEGKSSMKPSFIQQVISNPNQFYSPADLLDITRKYQHAIGVPGKQYMYSDTGYILLGLLAEKLYGKTFFEILNQQIFRPLKMNDSGLMFYDPKVKEAQLAPIIVKKKDIRTFTSLSIDFSGGGIITTTHDLTLFLKAMFSHQLISAESDKRVAQFPHHFKAGMFYGLGLMELRFEKFFFLLKGYPRLRGHLGVLGVHAWWNPDTGDTFVINVGNMDSMVMSFKLLIELATVIEKKRSNQS